MTIADLRDALCAIKPVAGSNQYTWELVAINDAAAEALVDAQKKLAGINDMSAADAIHAAALDVAMAQEASKSAAEALANHTATLAALEKGQARRALETLAGAVKNGAGGVIKNNTHGAKLRLGEWIVAVEKGKEDIIPDELFTTTRKLNRSLVNKMFAVRKHIPGLRRFRGPDSVRTFLLKSKGTKAR